MRCNCSAVADTVGGADLLGGARNRGCLLLLVVADDGYDLRHGELHQRGLCQWHLRVPRGLAGLGVPILRRKSQVSETECASTSLYFVAFEPALLDSNLVLTRTVIIAFASNRTT